MEIYCYNVLLPFSLYVVLVTMHFKIIVISVYWSSSQIILYFFVFIHYLYLKSERRRIVHYIIQAFTISVVLPSFPSYQFPTDIISLFVEENLPFRAGVLLMDSLDFPSENVFISSLFLKHIFAGYRIQDWPFFFVNIENLHCLWPPWFLMRTPQPFALLFLCKGYKFSLLP